jgi:hypothetical protein
VALAPRFLRAFASLRGTAPPHPANAPINLINMHPHLHLPNYSAKLEFHSSMLSGLTTRTLLPTTYGIPVGIIISILVIVPGPA